ncbi:MAG: cobaltochelatase subunit CobN [Alphaproteobacteria bacterium]|nr:cobaltochelatase subunit CobN [Alphaproteobacteria bacterium]
MHLLAAQPGEIRDGSEARDLGQTPGEIVFLSAADTEIALVSAAAGRAGHRIPRLRAANLLALSHNISIDLYADAVLKTARLIVVRLLGGRGYWPYGVERIAEIAREKNISVAFLPGGDEPDAELARLSTLAADAQHRLWQYLVHGGAANADAFLAYAASLLGRAGDYLEPKPLPRAGIFGFDSPEAAQRTWAAGRPLAAVVFYRALMQAGDTAAVAALLDELNAAGFNALGLYVSSLKDPVAAETVARVLDRSPPDVVLAATAFAATNFDKHGADGDPPFARLDCPVLQVVFAAEERADWDAGARGLSPRDLSMQVALTEMDGRILTRAVAFKGAPELDSTTEAQVRRLVPERERMAFVARQAMNWATLRRKPNAEKKILLVLANYPNRDGRAANGVGLDTPESAVGILRALKGEGYAVGDIPENGTELMRALLAGPTNGEPRRAERESLSFAEYQAFLAALPEKARAELAARWGHAESDPFHRPGAVDCGRFAVPALCFGRVAVAIQPARGYNLKDEYDPVAAYHDPALPPPHNYLAFHAWARDSFSADAVVHVGKHGNLEWLPGKALALSSACWPEAALGALPNVYPFIVNDPGEGAQAKRRASAVVVDHLTPPLARAESYGPQRALESLIDEYYEAARLDPRRLGPVAAEILSICRATGLDEDLGIARDTPEAAALQKLDAHLCELKDMQIRDGLHVFGTAPEGMLLDSLLAALARLPRGPRESILRALARDLGLAENGGAPFDPLDCDMTAPWDAARPKVLQDILSDAWRGAGDTVERLEALALALVSGRTRAEESWTRARAVLDEIETAIRPAVARSGPAEIAGVVRALSGRFVFPGPSGAPTRGRPEVLPTGRNFYSVDVRGVPTRAAWTLGWKSAALLVARHAQDTGDWPKSVALSAWGTANMRTGGDDIAQALALIGARPLWEPATGRVTGFEIMPLSVMDRPRVDVTLRVSGFFRDAFPGLIELFDSASRAVAALDEPADKNPLALRRRAEMEKLKSEGVGEKERDLLAGASVFGSRPGAYGAGLQALIDEKGWDTADDLARAYVAWGGYAYGSGLAGAARHALFERRLGTVQAVVQNQDNREHDILDSDDYYQFEGGLAAAVKSASGRAPAVYHADHSRPESPRIRTLEEEIARVVRARAANPKWIAGVMRHGYKGGFEMAATVDYLFAFAATAGAVRDHHFDQLFSAYLMDEKVRAFLAEHNPAALREMAERFQEAIGRDLWRPRLNSTRAAIKEILG